MALTLSILYLICIFSIVIYLKNLSQAALRMSWITLGLGLLLHLFVITSVAGRWLPATSSESHLFISALLAVAATVFSFRRAFLLLVIVLLILVVLSLMIFETGASFERPMVHAPWLWTHVSLMIIGEAMLAFGAAVSLVYLIAYNRLHRKVTPQVLAWVPSLPTFDKALGEILLAGFILLSLGFGIGLGFASEYWNRNWIWDPKIIFCVLTWIVYAVLLICRQWSVHFRGKRSALLAIVGFLGILFISWGLDHLFLSRHHSPQLFEKSEIR